MSATNERELVETIAEGLSKEFPGSIVDLNYDGNMQVWKFRIKTRELKVVGFEIQSEWFRVAVYEPLIEGTVQRAREFLQQPTR